MTRRLIVALVLAVFAASCSGAGAGDADAFVPTETSADCLLRLHGKGGDGATPRVEGDDLVLAPRGNDEAWDGWQWDYRTPEAYAEARAIVANTLDLAECERVVVHGFSNGAAMAAALYCDEAFRDQPIVGWVIDDPVTDDVPIGCVPDPDADAVLYWTSALAEAAAPGTSCSSIDWTCRGDTVRPIADYAADLGLPISTSIHADHVRYTNAPEIFGWLS